MPQQSSAFSLYMDFRDMCCGGMASTLFSLYLYSEDEFAAAMYATSDDLPTVLRESTSTRPIYRSVIIAFILQNPLFLLPGLMLIWITVSHGLDTVIV